MLFSLFTMESNMVIIDILEGIAEIYDNYVLTFSSIKLLLATL